MRRAGAIAAIAAVLALAPEVFPVVGRPDDDAGFVEADLSSPPAGADALSGARARGQATLRDLYTAARDASEQIGRAREAWIRARLLRTTARAGFLPSVTIEDTYYRQNSVSLALPAGVAGSAFTFADTRNEALVRVRQPIFSGLRETSFFDYARRNIEAFDAGLDDAGRQLYGALARSFYTALQREGDVKTYEDVVSLERERLREIEARLEVGLARKTEVLLVRTQLSDDESSLTRARNDLQTARDELSFLTGATVDMPLSEEEIPAIASDPSAVPLDSLVAIALENRSDLIQAERAVEASERLVGVARGDWLPSLDLDATWILDRYNYSQFSQATDWTAQLMLTVPVFDGGRAAAAVATARSNLRQVRLDRDEIARRIRLEVQNALLTWRSDLSRVKTLEDRVASAEENYSLIQEEYRTGLATNLEVVAAQNQLLSGRLDLENQRYQVSLDLLALGVAQGLLPEERPERSPSDPSSSRP